MAELDGNEHLRVQFTVERSARPLESGRFLLFDADAHAILLRTDDKCINYEHLVYFNNPASPGGAVQLTDSIPDSGDEEVIDIALDQLPKEINAIVFAVSLYDADKRYQTFAYFVVKAVATVNGVEVAESQFDNSDSEATAVVIAELRRAGGGWTFNRTIKEFPAGIFGLARDYKFPA